MSQTQAQSGLKREATWFGPGAPAIDPSNVDLRQYTPSRVGFLEGVNPLNRDRNWGDVKPTPSDGSDPIYRSVKGLNETDLKQFEKLTGRPFKD